MIACACGSGLRDIRCCGSDPAAWPAVESLALLAGEAETATRLFNEKNHREAEALALRILDLAPNHRDALRILLELRRAANHLAAAEALARRLAELAENSALASAANQQLAELLIAQGRYAEAEPALRRALAAAPGDAAIHHLLGVVFTETGRLRAGETHYRQAMALALAPQEDGVLLGNLAWNLRQQGLLEDAAALYRQALASRPDNRRAFGGLAQVEAGRGNFSGAAALLDEALSTAPDRGLRLLRAMLALSEAPQAVLDQLSDPPEQLLPAERLLRGQALLRLGRTAEAIVAFATAREAQRQRFGRRYQAALWEEKAGRYREFFSAPRLSALPRAESPGDATPRPVFLLGFPGSGTSLLEQLLSQIPGFAAADRFAPITALLERPELAGYPESLPDLLIGDARSLPGELNRRFHARLAELGFEAGQRFVTLRAPEDGWHLGLINLLFPDAPILHLLRHPLDVIISNFGQDKQLEGDCGVSIHALAQHYALTMAMIRHYRGQLALRYVPVRYEVLVREPAAVLRQIQDFLGDATPTPPEDQLRANPRSSARRQPLHVIGQQPIHDRGLLQYRAFLSVAPHLFRDIRPLIDPWLAELGYAG